MSNFGFLIRKLFFRLYLIFILILSTSLYASAQEEFTLRRSTSGDPETLDPHKILSAFESTILTDLFLPLASTSASDKTIPGSAKSWHISNNGLTYTFKMREGLKWSDGKPIDAYDFLYSIRRQLDPATASRTAEYFRPIINAENVIKGKVSNERLGVYAPDASTLIIELHHPAPYLMDILAIDARPVPKHIIDEYQNNWIRPGRMVVNGPFMLKEWVPGSHVKLIKNPLFFDSENVKLKTVFHIPTEDLNTGFQRFRAGELDTLVLFPPEKLDQIREKMPNSLQIIPGLSTEFYIFNTKKKPFDDARVRLALSMAIDREILVNRVLKTGEIPAYGFIPPTMNQYSIKPKVDFEALTMSERRDKAINLLKQAGFDENNPLIVPLRFNTQDLQARQAAAISAMWRAIGVQTKQINTERKVLAADRMNGNYSVARYLHVAGNYDATSFLLLLNSELSSRNYMNYQSQEFNRLFSQAWHTNNILERNKKMYFAELEALNDHPMIPLYFYSSRRLLKPYVKGWIANPRGVYPSRWVSIETKN